MPQRFPAQHRYQEILNIFQRWPGVGALSAKRWFQSGVGQKQFVAQLKRLAIVFDSLPPCPRCLIPSPQDQECDNCAQQENFASMVILGQPSDAFVIQTFPCLRQHYFIALPAYLSYQGQFDASDRQLSHVARLLERTPYQHCLLLFNQSLEARSTFWLLKQRSPEKTLWKDASFLTLDKDNLGHFSDIELKIYEQHLENYLAKS